VRLCIKYKVWQQIEKMLVTNENHFGELYIICRKLKDIYCDENDHLIKSNHVKSFKLKIVNIDKHVKTLSENVLRYDGKTKIEANGYRSIVNVTELLISRCVKNGQQIVSKVSKIKQVKEYLKSWNSTLKAIKDLLEMGVEIMELGKNGMLYPDKPDCQNEKVADLSKRLLNLDVTPFYGDLTGFHLIGDCSQMARILNIAMASYSDLYGGTMIKKFQNLKKLHYGYYYATSNDDLANKIVKASRSMQVDFAQSFYNMGEFPMVKRLKLLPKVSTSYLMNLVFQPLETPHTNINMMFKVPLPSSHIDKNFVQARLISNYRTRQMLGACRCMHGFVCNCEYALAQDTIMFHVHGGGFVSQTSDSHLDYLH
jgi:hormone-sensitive lipase